MKQSKRDWEKIAVSRKIVEHLISGGSLTQAAKNHRKGKGFVIRVKDLALEYGYIVSVEENGRVYKAGSRPLPPFPELIFPLHDRRRNKSVTTDSLLEAKREWIMECLGQSWSPQSIFEELGLLVPRSNFYRYLARHKLEKTRIPKNTIEIIHNPGECLQVDWGKLFHVKVPGTKRKKTVWIFTGVLGHSRYEMARVVERCDYQTTVACLISMFEELGGVPEKVTSDNPKVFVKKADPYEPLLNAGYERLASHYKFIIEALPPADPELKGKVERMMPMKRRLFESYDEKNYTLESAQAHADRKLKLANERKHGTHQQKPVEVMIRDEAAVLKPLPAVPYEIESIVYANIRADGYVRFENKYYRVDPLLKKEQALVIANKTQVSIYCKGKLLEVYERLTDPFRTRACKDHLREEWEKTIADHGHYLRQARAIGPNVERFTGVILARGHGFVDNRVVWGLLSLDKTWDKEDIDKACLVALEFSQVHLKAVIQHLRLHTTPKKFEVPDEQASAGPRGGRFQRDMKEYKNHLRLVHSQKS